MRDSRKKRNTEYPGIQLKPIKPNDLDRTSVNKDAALHFLRHISEVEMAKSLLAYDVRLFRRVIPWQCLGSVWSRREQRSSSEIHTVKATVKQFNHVVYIVLATVLSPCLSLAQRAKIVEKVSYVITARYVMPACYVMPVYYVMPARYVMPACYVMTVCYVIRVCNVITLCYVITVMWTST